jgi:hypothetical protein
MTIDWTALLKALMILALSIILGTMMIGYSLHEKIQIKNREQELQKKFTKVEGEYWDLRKTLEIVNHDYLANYNRLKKERFFTEKPDLTIDEQRFHIERKIDSDLLTPMKTHRTLFSSNYELLPANPYLISDIQTIDSFKAYQIPIHFELELFHEGHFLMFLKKLKDWDLPSLFYLQHFEVKRLRELNNLKDVSKPYFQANCVLLWYTSQLEND